MGRGGVDYREYRIPSMTLSTSFSYLLIHIPPTYDQEVVWCAQESSDVSDDRRLERAGSLEWPGSVADPRTRGSLRAPAHSPVKKHLYLLHLPTLRLDKMEWNSSSLVIVERLCSDDSHDCLRHCHCRHEVSNPHQPHATRSILTLDVADGWRAGRKDASAFTWLLETQAPALVFTTFCGTRSCSSPTRHVSLPPGSSQEPTRVTLTVVESQAVDLLNLFDPWVWRTCTMFYLVIALCLRGLLRVRFSFPPAAHRARTRRRDQMPSADVLGPHDTSPAPDHRTPRLKKP